MDDLTSKIEQLYKSLLSLKQDQRKDVFVPAIKSTTPSFKLSKPNKVSKIPGALPPASKKDPAKVAQQLKNPRPVKAPMEILKVEDNGQWSLNKIDMAPTVLSDTKRSGPVSMEREERKRISKAPIAASTAGFPKWHSSEQNKLIDGLDLTNATPMHGSKAGGAQQVVGPNSNNLIVKNSADHNDPEGRGHLENGFNSARREVLFHNLARDYFGMEKHVPATAGFTKNGDEHSAQQMVDAKHLDQDNDGKFKYPNHSKILNNLQDSGDLHKLALMDNILGYHDRHSNNYMMGEKDNNLHLIDNGTAFDYINYDNNATPLGPDNKHYPSFLNHSGDLGKDHTTLHPEAVKWLNTLDPEEAKRIMVAHGQDETSRATQGMLRRLQGAKNAVNGGVEHYKSLDNLLAKNRLTTGPLFKHV